jgi:3-oxoadipate CoA-transferase alpha subunit
LKPAARIASVGQLRGGFLTPAVAERTEFWMIDKRVSDLTAALAGVRDGATVLVSGFGEAGNPTELVHELINQGAKDLTIVNNNAGNGTVGLAALLAAKRARRIICSYPRSAQSDVFNSLYAAGEIELELTPQGTLAERIRSAGAGVGAFFTPTGAGTDIGAGKEIRVLDGRPQILEHALRGDVALVKAEAADRWGNLIFRKAARNFGPIMCMAADLVIVQVRRIVEIGELDPEAIVTPGIFVDRVVEVPNPVSERDLLLAAAEAAQ